MEQEHNLGAGTEKETKPVTKLIQPQPQVTEDLATKDTDHQDCKVKCKYCDRYFNTVLEMNIHINRRHKKVQCPECEKQFVKQVDCDNHFKDVHRLPKFLCRIKGCPVYAHNDLKIDEHMRYTHWSKLIFWCNKCPKVFFKHEELHKHLEDDHGRISLRISKHQKYPCIRCKQEFLDENVTNSYFVLWEFSTSQKELLLVSSRSISSLISGGNSGDSWVLVCALGLL